MHSSTVHWLMPMFFPMFRGLCALLNVYCCRFEFSMQTTAVSGRSLISHPTKFPKRLNVLKFTVRSVVSNIAMQNPFVLNAGSIPIYIILQSYCGFLGCANVVVFLVIM